MKRQERLTLNELSLKAYGRACQWQKILSRGEVVDRTEKLEDGKEVTRREVKYFSLDEIITKMNNKIKSDEEQKAKEEAIKKRDEEVQAKVREKNVSTQPTP